MELLLGKYTLPLSAHPDSVLARRETSLFVELSDVLSSFTHHRDAEVNRRILPHCQPFVAAIGHRMAYDAAVDAGVMPALTDLYVADVVQADGAWYAEQTTFSRSARNAAEEGALDAVLPHMEHLIDDLGAKPYLTAPIVSDEAWDEFTAGLQVYGRTEAREKVVQGIPGYVPQAGDQAILSGRLAARL